MSVIKAKRAPGKFEVLVKARNLCVYTLGICKNEKSFPKRNRWILTQPIVNEALAMLSCIRRANAVRVVRAEDYVYRRGQQAEAYARAEALLALIDLAYNVLGLEARRVEYWTGLVLEAEDKLKNWQKSDRERYGELCGAQAKTEADSAPQDGA